MVRGSAFQPEDPQSAPHVGKYLPCWSVFVQDTGSPPAPGTVAEPDLVEGRASKKKKKKEGISFGKSIKNYTIIIITLLW